MPQNYHSYLKNCAELVEATSPLVITGQLTRVTGLVMEAIGLKLAIGSGATVLLPNGNQVDAEVVGFSGDRVFLMPQHDVYGLVPGAKVIPLEIPQGAPGAYKRPRRRATDRAKYASVGFGLLGRILDATGRPLDQFGPLKAEHESSLQSRPYNPIERAPINQTLDVGVRSINALLSIGRGQRMGLLAASGVGKSVLLGMMARYTTADITVVGLIGERGREVKEFIENSLGPEGLKRSVVVAAPADTSPLLRIQGAAYATAIAEYFRDQGKHVLLIMDSLTRYAMAQREIALAIGEPPATRGYPPSVFARIPQLIERAGNGREGSGSITAFYTVLTEGEDQHDPIAEASRAILDGHILLSRDLAEQGHYPAIDIETSISRTMTHLISKEHFEQVRHFKHLHARYQRSRDLINVGAYVAGSDPVLDEALALHSKMSAFLQQDMHERETYIESKNKLAALFSASKPK